MVIKRKEEQRMKTLKGVLIFIFLTGMILGVGQPAMLFAGETPSGNIWDQFVDPKPYPGIILEGPLSVYYEYLLDVDPCEDGQPVANMYYTVRLNKEFARGEPPLYTFQGTTGICLGDMLGQGTVIKEFLGTAVNTIFPKAKSWKLKSINKAQYHDDDFSRAFVADIEIAVKK
jgi:hypothetical protein